MAPIITPAQLKAAREKLGLTQKAMASWLFLPDDGSLRGWEGGRHRIPGPVIKCLVLARLIELPTTDDKYIDYRTGHKY